MAALLLAMLAQDPVVVDAFEGDSIALTWKTSDSTLSLNRDAAGLKEGSGSLRWEAQAAKAALSTTAIPADWTTVGRLLAWVKLSDAKERTLEVELKEKAGGAARWWRKIALKPGVWTEISVAPYHFRAEGFPGWNKLATLGFVLRDGPANLFVDHVRIEKHKGALPPFLEPGDALVARVFGEAKNVVRASTKNFRVFSNAPLDGDKLCAALEEFLVLFHKTLGREPGDLPYPATLVIHATREAYVDGAVKTAREVYGAELQARRVTSDGYTFFEYSMCSWLAAKAERRPVFFHEVCHQLVTRTLGLRGARGATWVEEGLCYFLQNEFLPQDDLAAEVKSLLENSRRPKLAEFDVEIVPGGAVNLEAMTVMAFLARGKHKEQLTAMLTSLGSDANLKNAVEKVLKTTLAEFEADWQAFCRDRYR